MRTRILAVAVVMFAVAVTAATLTTAATTTSRYPSQLPAAHQPPKPTDRQITAAATAAGFPADWATEALPTLQSKGWTRLNLKTAPDVTKPSSDGGGTITIHQNQVLKLEPLVTSGVHWLGNPHYDTLPWHVDDSIAYYRGWKLGIFGFPTIYKLHLREQWYAWWYSPYGAVAYNVTHTQWTDDRYNFAGFLQVAQSRLWTAYDYDYPNTGTCAYHGLQCHHTTVRATMFMFGSAVSAAFGCAECASCYETAELWMDELADTMAAFDGGLIYAGCGTHTASG